MNDAQDNYVTATNLAAVKFHLKSLGYHFEEEDIPGLYRINDGPEITTNQLILFAMSTRIEPIKW